MPVGMPVWRLSGSQLGALPGSGPLGDEDSGDLRSCTPVPCFILQSQACPLAPGPHAGQRALHTCVCICSNVRQFQSMLWTNIGSVFVAWPCFVSQNLWIKYNDCGHLYLSLQAFALRLALLRLDLLIRVRMERKRVGEDHLLTRRFLVELTSVVKASSSGPGGGGMLRSPPLERPLLSRPERLWPLCWSGVPLPPPTGVRALVARARARSPCDAVGEWRCPACPLAQHSSASPPTAAHEAHCLCCCVGQSHKRGSQGCTSGRLAFARILGGATRPEALRSSWSPTWYCGPRLVPRGTTGPA